MAAKASYSWLCADEGTERAETDENYARYAISRSPKAVGAETGKADERRPQAHLAFNR